MAFSFKRSITVNSGQVPSTQSSYPMLVSGTFTYLKTVGNGGKVQNSSGYDIGFYSDSGLTTKLSWETERYIATTGEVVFWVKVPSISTSTQIWMAYGDASISSFQGGATGAAWDSNYTGVWHQADGTTPNYADSTAGGHALTPTANAPTATTGQIDGAINYGGGNQFNGQGASSGLLGSGATSPNGRTLSAWIKFNTFRGTDNNPQPVLGLTFNNGNQVIIAVQYNSSTDVVTGWLDNGSSGNTYTSSGTSALSTGTWYYFVVLFTGTSTKDLVFYLNGSAVGSPVLTDVSSVSSGVNDNVYINAGLEGRYGDISADEVRTSNIVRSSDWITTEYNNQSSPSGFFSIGSETPVGGGNVGSFLTFIR